MQENCPSSARPIFTKSACRRIETNLLIIWKAIIQLDEQIIYALLRHSPLADTNLNILVNACSHFLFQLNCDVCMNWAVLSQANRSHRCFISQFHYTLFFLIPTPTLQLLMKSIYSNSWSFKTIHKNMVLRGILY